MTRGRGNDARGARQGMRKQACVYAVISAQAEIQSRGPLLDNGC